MLYSIHRQWIYLGKIFMIHILEGNKSVISTDAYKLNAQLNKSELIYCFMLVKKRDECVFVL